MNVSRTALGGLVALAALLALPDAAEACAVCFQAKTDGSRIAFIATTAGMTAMPLLLVGGFVWWVRKQFRDAGAPEESPTVETTPRSTPLQKRALRSL